MKADVGETRIISFNHEFVTLRLCSGDYMELFVHLLHDRVA